MDPTVWERPAEIESRFIEIVDESLGSRPFRGVLLGNPLYLINNEDTIDEILKAHSSVEAHRVAFTLEAGVLRGLAKQHTPTYYSGPYIRPIQIDEGWSQLGYDVISILGVLCSLSIATFSNLLDENEKMVVKSSLNANRLFTDYESARWFADLMSVAVPEHAPAVVVGIWVR